MRTDPACDRRPPARRRLAAAAAALALAACLKPGSPADAAPAIPPLKQAPDGRPLELTFADDFDVFRPWRNGRGVWRTTYRDGRARNNDDFHIRTLRWNKEVQLYVDPEMRGHRGQHAVDEPPGLRSADDPPLGLDPFRISDGKLEIRFDRAPAALEPMLGGFKYISGLITSQPSFSQTYGYFEMRAKLPRGKGLWPAFWLLPSDLSWPPEIDVMESIGDPGVVYTTYHSKTGKIPGQEIRISPEGFHTFAVSWDPEHVVWFIDGREVRREKTPADMHKPMYLLANVGSGGDWAGPPDHTTPLPAVYAIDFIRAYKFR